MCNIVPCHIYNNLLEKGDEEEKSFASSALTAIKNFFYDPEKILESYLLKLNELEAEEEAPNRSIYDAKNKMELPGVLVRKEGAPSNGDVAVEEAYDGSGKTFELLQKAFGRNSIDNKGMELVSTVHFGKNFANAFWNGSSMTYGDGDGKIFNRFTSVIDVVGHEIFHGVTERSAGLVYRYQPGALNEHFSDVFGSMVKQYSLNQTADKADWLIGEGLFTKKINAKGLRDMRNPGKAYDDPRIGKDPQPDHMDKFIKTEEDNGGVHWNSGIPNKAFATAAIHIGGHSWEKIGKVWYNVLTKELNSKSQFIDCANATVKVAGKLFGDKSVEQKAVVEGWRAVGIAPKL